MAKKNLKAIVIGGGIHGLTASIALAEKGIQVSLLEKKQELFKGTSGATHNRAHLGYHYPRSIETAIECQEGLNFFKEKYPETLYYPKENFYLIEKYNSFTNFNDYIKFCDKVNLPYEIFLENDEYWNKNMIEGGLKVPEPVFNMNYLPKILEKEALGLGVKIEKETKLKGLKKKADNYIVLGQKGNEIKRYDANIILNATYAYINNTMKLLGLEEDIINYRLQKTEVVVAKTEKKFPALTIMDGKFISFMPFAGMHNENMVLMYDVENSVLEEKEEFFLDDTKKYKSNFKKMVEKGEKYFPFMKGFEYQDSLFGFRPIPIDATGDSRKTRILSHKSATGIYSICEGKFISAPLIAERLIKKIQEEGLVD